MLQWSIAWRTALGAEGPCEAQHREVWGALVDVVDHGALAQTDARFHHVRVHRPVEQQRLQRFVRQAVPASPGMVLCHGDWLETWHGTEVTVEEVGARALLTLHGGALVWFDRELRQVRGIVDYYVLDSATLAERESPVPVALGYSGLTASRQDSTFRIELLDPATGEAMVAVSDANDLFLREAPLREHGVSVGALRVAGGSAARVVDGRVLGVTADDLRETLGELDAAVAALEQVAAVRWAAAPDASAWAAGPRSGHRIALGGLAYPDQVLVDGEPLPPMNWRRVRLSDGTRGVATVGRVPLEPGFHEVEVATWGQTSEGAAQTSLGGEVLEVARPGLPGRADWYARRRLLDRYVRAERFEVRASLGAPRTSASDNAAYGLPDPLTGELLIDPSTAVAGQGWTATVPVRAFFAGGRLWLEAAATGGLLTASAYTFDGEPRPGALVVPWATGQGFAGVSAGNRLVVDLGLGALAVPRFDGGAPIAEPRQVGVRPRSALTARLTYGRTWQVAVDATGTFGWCSFAGDLCSQSLGAGGLAVSKALGAVSPFVRYGTSFSVHTTDVATPEGRFTDLRTAGLEGGLIWRPVSPHPRVRP